jgi:hypothetical protein
MNKRFEMNDVLTIRSENTVPDKEAIEAQKQWEATGTVNLEYLTHVLGDISQPVSVSPHDPQQRKANKDKTSCK